MQSNETKNAKRRARRLKERKARLAGLHCLNCDVLLSERLEGTGRSFKYCRMCLTEHQREVMRARCRAYYHRKRRTSDIMAKKRAYSRKYRESYHPYVTAKRRIWWRKNKERINASRRKGGPAYRKYQVREGVKVVVSPITADRKQSWAPRR